jgi:hypothetical protein
VTKKRVWQALSLILCGAFLAIGVLELWVRHHKSGSRHRAYARAEKLLEGKPWKDAFLRDRQKSFGHLGAAYHDYYLASPLPLTSETTNYDGNYYSARACPDSVADGEEEHRVWFFGGSTMENLTTIDQGTIANQAIKALNDAGHPSIGRNFGTRSFHSTLETIKFQDLLRREPPEKHPTVVIFYDGYNDAWHSWYAGPGNLPFDTGSRSLSLLIEGRDWQLLTRSLRKFGGDYSMLLRRLDKMLGKREAHSPLEKSPQNVRSAVEIYRDNMRMTRAVCREMGIRPVFFLQPLLISKTDLSTEEVGILAEEHSERRAFIEAFYEEAQSQLAQEEGFHDFSGALNQSGRWDFYDMGHTGPDTSVSLGQSMGNLITRELQQQ